MKLTTRSKLGYASAAIGDAASYSFIGTFLMFFLTVVAGINPITAGLIAALGSLWDTLWSPIIGYWSDHTRSTMGRRRPYLMVAAFPLAIFVCLLFTSINASPFVKALYYLIMVMGFWTAFATFFNPYLALGAEFTDDYDERTLLRSYAYGFNMLGTIVGMVLPTMIVDLFMSHGRTLAQSWSITAGFVGGVSMISILITVFASKNHVSHTYEGETLHVSFKVLTALFREYLDVLKLRPVKYMLGACMLYLMTHTLICSDRLYFFTYNLGLSARSITLLMLIGSFVGILFIPLVIGLSKRLDKRSAMILLIGISGLLIFSAKFAHINSFLGMAVFIAIFGLGNTAYWQVMPALLYDVCEYDELETGRRREGTLSSLLSLSEALTSAIAMQILGIILGLAGFDGDSAVQSATALVWIENALTILPALLMFAAIFMLYKYPITKKRFQEIQAELRLRNNQ